MKLSKNLFFKGGKSSRGKSDDFEFEMCDFRQLPVSSDFTVGTLYDEVKMPVLRFYLQTKKSQGKSQGEKAPKLKKVPKLKKTPQQRKVGVEETRNRKTKKSQRKIKLKLWLMKRTSKNYRQFGRILAMRWL